MTCNVSLAEESASMQRSCRTTSRRTGALDCTLTGHCGAVEFGRLGLIALSHGMSSSESGACTATKQTLQSLG